MDMIMPHFSTVDGLIDSRPATFSGCFFCSRKSLRAFCLGNYHIRDVPQATSPFPLPQVMSSTIPGFNPVYETVENEGASLKVWHQGDGPLLILIQGGGGDGGRFDKSLPFLSQHYKVATYDRRGNGGSTVAKPRTLSPVESARDVVAIIRFLGCTKASLFGTSSGGLIALQVAESYAEYVESVVIHEVPICSILPDEAIKRMDSAYLVHQTYLEMGTEAAFQVFRASVTGEPVQLLQKAAKDAPPHRLDFFFKYEFLILIIYTPNLLRIRDSDVPIATVEGVESKGVFHATSAKVQSEILRCQHVVWPGAHVPFVEHPEVFAEELHKTIRLLHE